MKERHVWMSIVAALAIAVWWLLVAHWREGGMQLLIQAGAGVAAGFGVGLLLATALAYLFQEPLMYSTRPVEAQHEPVSRPAPDLPAIDGVAEGWAQQDAYWKAHGIIPLQLPEEVAHD